MAASAEGSDVPGRALDHPSVAIVVGGAVTVACALPTFAGAATAVDIAAEFGFGAVGMGAIVAAFFASASLAAPVLGGMVDRIGARRSLLAGTSVATLAAVAISAVAGSLPILLAWQFVAGLGAAAVQPAANRLIARRVPGRRLGMAMGLKQSAAPLASALAGLAVPTLGSSFGWRAVFLAAGCFAALTTVAVAVFVPAPVVAGAGRRRASSTGPIENVLILGVALALGLAASSSLLALFVDASRGAGMTGAEAGWWLSVAGFSALAVRVLTGAICDRYAASPLRVAAVLLGTGGAGYAMMIVQHPSAVRIGAVVALAGSWGYPAVFWLALMQRNAEAPGRATGHVSPAGLGAVLGPIALGSIAASYGYVWTWAGCAVLATASAGLMLRAHRRASGSARS